MFRFLRIRPLILALGGLLAFTVLACDREVAQESQPTAQPAIEVTAEPTVEPVAAAGPPIYQMGIFAEPISRNFWNYYGGPAGSVWTGYVLAGWSTSLYGYSDQRFEWVPVAAADFPTDLKKETVGGTEFWTTEVTIKTGLVWSDGEEITAEDFVFTVNTVMDLELGSNWASAVDPAFVDRVEAIDSHVLKIFFKATDDEGNPQTPGLSVWQFGLGFMPILPEHYWAPVVEEAKQAGDGAQQIEALFAHVPEGEPTAGGFTFSKWEPGAFFENKTSPDFFDKGTIVTLYENGAITESNERHGYAAGYYGEPQGDTVLEYEVGPHVDSEIFSIYGNQDAAVLALTNGDIDFVFNPLGLEKGFQDRIMAADDVQIITNPDNGMFYMGFNVRKPPMSIPEFRQAVATVIDKEFVAQTILQGAAIPMYSLVPEGNTAWHNPNVSKFGQGLSRGERVQQAVELLKSAGFTYEQEPQVGEDGSFVAMPGQGLKMPDGSDVPPLELIAPSAGYDPLRATFAIWIERWLNDLGIPIRANLLGFNLIVDKLFSDTVARDLDLWILGWSLNLFPDYLEAFFHSRNAPENQEGGNNWGGYANPAYDDLSFKLLSETTIEGAKETVFRLQEFLADDLPYVPLFTIPKLDSYRPSRVEFPYTSVLGGLEGQSGMQQVVLVK
ncbi:MAG: ABC transporter substrate-binding protein [Chloroflexi bacterium]|nr:ABC transporter substrate-binding protein [Chloroflexota bacterium]MCY3937968.1 ABC transporter substrate-binding protein [Chloroflexota bacterium]